LKIINRYLVKEILQPFGIVLFVLTFVLLMGKILQLMDLMINKGVGLSHIARLILFLLPSFLVFTLPISLLVSVLIALGRLSSDNELTVLKASGISLYRLTPPILMIALVSFMLTAATTLFLVPYSNTATKALIFNVARNKASIGIKEKVFNADFNGVVLYAEKVPSDGRFMEGVLVSDQRTADEPGTIIAKKAFLVADPKSMTVTLRLEDGSTYFVAENMKIFRKMDFKTYDINLDLQSSSSDAEKMRTKALKEMTPRELIQNLKSGRLDDKIYRKTAMELYEKFSIPLSCLVFSILAIPLGVKPHHRSVKSRGFTIGLMTVLLYYLLQLGCEGMVTVGKLSPFLGSWIPNILFTIAGTVLYFMAATERSFQMPWFFKLFKRRNGREKMKKERS